MVCPVCALVMNHFLFGEAEMEINVSLCFSDMNYSEGFCALSYDLRAAFAKSRCKHLARNVYCPVAMSQHANVGHNITIRRDSDVATRL